MHGTESDWEEKVREQLSKGLGFLPEELEALREFLKTNRNILKFYLNEYGLHLNPAEQIEISELSRQSDLLALKTARIEFQAKLFETEAFKACINKKKFLAVPQEAKTFKKQLNEVQNELFELNQKVGKIIEKLENKITQ